MHKNLFDNIDIPKENINLLDDTSSDLEKECADYEKKITAAGGIDLFLGGIGADGHIAFNEPGSSLSSRTRIKTLCNETIRDNARFFENIKDVPTTALTVGVGTVMDAKEVVIMISGEKKAMALYKCIEEGINHMWTVSIFQNHPKVVIVCDDAATSELKVKTVNYFKELQRTTDMFGRPKCNLVDDEIVNNGKTIIFSPHPDDDVIGVGGIMNMISNKDKIKIAYMTSGEGGLPKSYPRDTREKEATLAVKILGYEKENIDFLSLPFYGSNKSVGRKDLKDLPINTFIKEDIAVLAVYPTHLSYLLTLNMLLELSFKKIIVVYSTPNDDHNVPNFDSKRIQMIKVDNIGHDFKKYYTGLVAAQNDTYKRIWLLNDSFVMTTTSIFALNRWNEILSDDLIGYHDSYDIKHHIQSYFMVLSDKAVKYYIERLASYKFTQIDTPQKKRQLIVDLEVGLSNYLLTHKDYKCSALYTISETLYGNPNFMISPRTGLVKAGPLTKSGLNNRCGLSGIQILIFYVTKCAEFIETYNTCSEGENMFKCIQRYALLFH